MAIIRTSRPFTSGRIPNRVFICGEKPGDTENRRGLPFVGRSGKEQRLYLDKAGWNVDDFYLTNVSKVFHSGNPDPTEGEILDHVPILLSEIAEVQPDIIVTVGQFATDWFLGTGPLKISEVNGVPHRIGCFEHNPWTFELYSLTSARVVPIIHPASGLRSEIMRNRVFWGYSKIGEYIKQVMDGEEIHCPTIDKFPDPSYFDVGGRELESILRHMERDAVGIDTEGRPGKAWSIQVCFDPGIAYCLRCIQPDFAVGIAALQQHFFDNSILVVLHNASTPMGCMYDLTMCREMGLDLSPFEIFDTMYDAYLQRVEPGSLKVLGWRCAGLIMPKYEETVGSTLSQIAYLQNVQDLGIPHPGKFQVMESDGTVNGYSPRSVSSRAGNFLKKIQRGDVYKSSEDLRTKWNKISGTAGRKEILEELKSELEYTLGPMPETTLADIPLDEAVTYACRDADATLRVFHHWGGYKALSRLHLEGTKVLKILERMQCKGMPIDPQFFENLQSEIDVILWDRERTVSAEYCEGKPFNPNSTPGVAWLLEHYGIETKKRTKSGLPSTGSESIEHLRADVQLVDDILTCREWRKTKTFCKIMLTSRDQRNIVRYRLKMSTASRRLAAEDPNVLAIPKEDRYGFNIRSGFVCLPGYYFGAFDYGQQELRMMADESRDIRLCRVFIQGRDIHTETACRAFGVTADNVEKWQRDAAKVFNFAPLYGASAIRLRNELQMKGIDWSLDECEQFNRAWFDIYKGVAMYKKKIIRFVKQHGYVKDRWGMRRYLPGIWDKNDRKLRSEAERQAINLRIQGGSQGQTQRAMLWLDPQIERLKRREGLEIDWCLQVHDELVFIAERKAIKPLHDLVIHGMVNHCGMKMKVPIVADGAFHHTWGGLKG